MATPPRVDELGRHPSLSMAQESAAEGRDQHGCGPRKVGNNRCQPACCMVPTCLSYSVAVYLVVPPRAGSELKCTGFGWDCVVRAGTGEGGNASIWGATQTSEACVWDGPALSEIALRGVAAEG